MTVQLELDFLSTYAYKAVFDLAVFVASGSGLENRCTSSIDLYNQIERQAIDLKNYAFLNDYIGLEEYKYLSDSILESLHLFWGA